MSFSSHQPLSWSPPAGASSGTSPSRSSALSGSPSSCSVSRLPLMSDTERQIPVETRTLRYGVVGFGYWGPNLARPIHQSERSRLVAIADQDAARRARAAREYPNARIVTDAQD